MYFGEKVRQLRAGRNLTQPQLAAAIGIEQSYLSKLENDKSVPSADIFQAILKAFSIDVATLLAGVDDRQIRSDLRQVPEVAEHLKAQVTTRIHSIKAWLFGSGAALVLGLTLGFAGYCGLLFANTQYNYYSAGVLLPGEPVNYLETGDQAALRIQKRFAQDFRLLDEYRGEGFIESAPGGTRAYTLIRTSEFERPQNRWLMLLGALLGFGGIVGFVVEARLRRVRL